MQIDILYCKDPGQEKCVSGVLCRIQAGKVVGEKKRIWPDGQVEEEMEEEEADGRRFGFKFRIGNRIGPGFTVGFT